MRKIGLIWMGSLLLVISQYGFAQNESKRYVTAEFGLNAAQGFDFTGRSSDQGSVCDPYINPDADSREVAGCPTSGTGWVSSFDGAAGIVTSIALGYDFDAANGQVLSRLRGELEYVYRHVDYDETTQILSQTGVARDKLDNEVYLAQERVSSVTAHSVFLNAIFDFENWNQARPYIGLGIGFAQTSIDNGRVWVRNVDWNEIQTGTNLPNSEDVRRNLAGTTSSAQTNNSDMLLGFQLLGGLDFKLTESVRIGVKARWVQLGSLEDRSGLDVLRSHQPPAGYFVDREADPIQYSSIGLYMTTQY